MFRIARAAYSLGKREQMKVTSETATEWLPVLESASHEVFQTMLGTRLEPWQQEEIQGVGFMAMVGLAGGLCGVLSVRCCQQSAAEVASCLLGDAPNAHAEEQSWDALGELANMIAGNFKNKIEGLSENCMLSVPTVVTGADYRAYSLADSRPLELWFKFRGHGMEIALEIHS